MASQKEKQASAVPWPRYGSAAFLLAPKWTTLEKLNKQHLSGAFVGFQLCLFIGWSVIYGHSCPV